MSHEEAQQGLVALLDAATPNVREYVFAQWRSHGGATEEEGKRTEEKLEELEG